MCIVNGNQVLLFLLRFALLCFDVTSHSKINWNFIWYDSFGDSIFEIIFCWKEFIDIGNSIDLSNGALEFQLIAS